jgi:hypothetical protein
MISVGKADAFSMVAACPRLRQIRKAAETIHASRKSRQTKDPERKLSRRIPARDAVLNLPVLFD